MHDRLFDHQGALDHDDLRAAARALDLDLERFTADAADPSVAARVARDRKDAAAAGLSSMPTFYLDDELLLDPWPTLNTRVPQLLEVLRADERRQD